MLGLALLRIERYSPAAIESAAASIPANPANRITVAPDPANPSPTMCSTLVARALAASASRLGSRAVHSQKESYEREIDLESEELRDDPEAEVEELALIYRAKS